MGNKVFANGREVACKAGSGKSIAAFPDVCLSPPSPPAGPVPIPYPVTAMDSDTKSGSKHVKVSGKEVMLKDQSSFKKCTGDEAATKTLGMGVITHGITGKVFFCTWSMDVKFEGQNAVRHLDMMTHNHMSQPGQTPPWTFMKRAALADSTGECAKEVEDAKTACTPEKEKLKCPSKAGIDAATEKMAKAKELGGDGSPQHEAAKVVWAGEYRKLSEEIGASDCHTKMRCLLAPFRPVRCCPGQTGDHLVDASCFFDKGRGEKGSDSTPMPGCKDYDAKKAPCMCVEGPNNTTATHGLMHTFKGNAAIKNMAANNSDKVTFAQARKQGVDAAKEVFPESGCSTKCLEAQLNKYHNDKNIDDKTSLRGSASGRTSDADVTAAKDALAASRETGDWA